MELSRTVRIPVCRELVWESLNDPVILKNSLPGCQAFTARAENEFDLVVVAKVGPVKATFTGEVILSDVVPPSSCRISGGGKGGVAGFAKGEAEVRLASTDDGTVMTCRIEATMGGKLAQIGSRLISGAASTMVDEFLVGFVRLVSGDEDSQVQIETSEAINS